jgi:putative polyhydroxyalkanoate system protein
MSRTITVTVPHKLSQEEAKRRISSGITDAKTRFAAMTKGVQETWEGDRMNFRLSTMGQDITGRLHVEPQQVRLEVDLPLILAMFADKLKPRIEEEGRKLLSGPEKQQRDK